MEELSPEEIEKRELTRGEISYLAARWLRTDVPDHNKAAELLALAHRGETAFELASFALEFLKVAESPGVAESLNGQPLLDCCGTGGGGVPLFNVSTGAMFLLGAMGIPVVKHGNRAVTKSTGSADVLEALGVRIQGLAVRECLEKVGVAFLFAPQYHPAFAAVAPLRKQLGAQGKRTIFNLLGPLLNPARPGTRLVGVFSSQMVELYCEALNQMGSERHLIVCGYADEQAIGEVSTCGNTLWQLGGFMKGAGQWSRGSEEKIESVMVKNATESAAIIERVLRGEQRGLARELLIANAGAAAWAHDSVTGLEEGKAWAGEVLDSGAAIEVLRRWREFSNGSLT